MNVILYIATIFNVGFCQNIYEPFDDQELGFLQEGRLHTLVSRIDNCEIQRNHEKRYLTEKITTTENILKSGLEMISRLDYIIASSIESICKSFPSLVFASPTECQLYYNCSMKHQTVPENMTQHMMECQYPEVFSDKTSSCEHFSEVNCGMRKEIKSYCNYRNVSDAGSLLCENDHPSCENKTDGLHEWQARANNGGYIQCLKERLVKTDHCPYDTIWKSNAYLYKGECTSFYAIPGRGLRSCQGMNDGNYDASIFYLSSGLGQLWPCRVYFNCKNGITTPMTCPNGTIFEERSGKCKTGKGSFSVECQIYCDSTKTDMQECSYPDMFSEETMSCENFTKVECGPRKEVVDYCQTRIVPERCSACSNPCIDEYPSCKGLENGFQAWPSKPNTEYWVVCYKKRLLEKGRCKEDSNWKSRTLPYNGTCTSVFAIPGESLPSCAGKPNGNFDTSQFFSTGPWLCNAYYNCKDGVTTAHVCPNGTVFDGKSGECKMGSYAFSAMCQLYCSSLEWSVGYDFSEGMKECEYPQLFSSESATCENFTDVTCGTRHEEKEGCNYLKEKYNFRRGLCSEKFPSCKNKPDGMNEHPIKRPAPYFITCLQERLIDGGICEFDTFWGVQTFPYNNTCVQAYAIPKAEYSLGKLPSCNGTTGSYRYDDSPCDVYYRCENGTATAVKCPENYNLNTVSGNCELNYPCN